VFERRPAYSLPRVPIPYGRQTVEPDDVAAVERVLRGDWLTQGPDVATFERALADAVGAPHAVAFSSGTAALHAAASAAGLGPGDRLATSAITFAASANCAAYVGATPVFADIDPATWNVSADTLTAAAGPSGVKAAVPVHFTGLPAPVQDIRAALGDDVVLIEDAAHALGSTVDGTPVGACEHSDMAIFSFHPVKAIATGEGGAVTTRDPVLARRLAEFRNHGIAAERGEAAEAEGAWFYEQRALGFNYRITDLQCALGSSQLGKLDRFVERRGEIAARYREEFADLDAIELPPCAPQGSQHAYHLFVVSHRGGAAARRALYEGLRAREILVQVHYIPVYWHPWYRETYGYDRGMCAAAERYYEGCLSLPCFPLLTDEDQDRVIAAVRELA
jgi:UDP-4-amino-4,6-dideoxy-N-acetyl-beta-L-altrosamine transaminase